MVETAGIVDLPAAETRGALQLGHTEVPLSTNKFCPVIDMFIASMRTASAQS